MDVIFTKECKTQQKLGLFFSIGIVFFTLPFLFIRFSHYILLLVLFESMLTILLNIFLSHVYEIKIEGDGIAIQNMWRKLSYPGKELADIRRLRMPIPYPLNPYLKFIMKDGRTFIAAIPNPLIRHLAMGRVDLYVTNLKQQLIHCSSGDSIASEPIRIFYSSIKIRRRELLPWWIKISTLLFLVSGALTIPLLILASTGHDFQLEFYGFETNYPFSLIGIMIFLIFSLKGVVSYSLWFGKEWALKIGKIDAIIGIVLCVISMCHPLLPHSNASFNFRIELLLLVPYLDQMNKLRTKWRLDTA